MKQKLIPRERVKLALNFQEPDRPPIRFYATLCLQPTGTSYRIKKNAMLNYEVSIKPAITNRRNIKWNI